MINLPTITERTFGIEIEFVNASPRTVATALNEVVDCHYEGYTHQVTRHWKVVTDSSLNSYDNAGEVVSPILKGVEGARELERVCTALDTIEGIKVNRQCGLHVHLDANDMTVGQIQTVYNRYADYEAQIDLVMPRSRRGDARWAAKLDDKDEVNHNRVKSKRDLSNATYTRYKKLNLESLTKYGTIEFRQHSGTLSFVKMINWISFLMQFVERSIQLTTVVRTKRVNRNRPYHLVRTLLENNGYEVNWQRGRNYWLVTFEGVAQFKFTNEEINIYYTTARENSLNKQMVYHWLMNNGIGVVEEDYVSRANRVEALNNITDEGWLDGIDNKVTNYLEERQEELN